MTTPIRWSLLVLLLLFLLSLITLSRIASSSSSFSSSLSTSTSSAFQLHHLQEEHHLRSRNEQIKQDLEENDLQLELDCASPPSSLSPVSSSSSTLSREERSLQEADFELELSLEIQHQIQKHRFDSTLLNESPSALHRHLERKLRHQKRLQAAYRVSLHQQASLSYTSQECVAWRIKQRWLVLQDQQQRKQNTSLLSSSTDATESDQVSSMGHNIAVTDAAVLTRFQQFHPNRRDLDPKSIFAQTLNALAQRQYTDPNGFVVELDPSKLMAGSRRASAYQNDDIHVLVLDMQWDPEVTVVVGNVLDETVRLRQEGYRPVMLNVGNSHIPGGDYHLDTATDNEADIFRRTTLHQCLDQEPRRTRFYPLPESGGIYCPNQAVFRHGRDKDNEFMDRFEWISVVSVASISKLETREKGGGLGGVQFLEGEDDLLRRKILAAMKVGVSQGHDALILPPHGAEAGQNPAEAIAAIYRSIIGRDFMGGRKRFQTYKKIVMVLDPEQADKIVNETSSYRPLQPFSIVATPLPVQEGEKELSTSQADGQDSGKEPDLVDKKDINARRQKTPLRRRAVYESTNPEGVAAEAEPYKDDQVFVEQSQEGSDVADDADSDRDQIESSESFDELMGDHHDEDGEESEKSDQDTSSSDEGDDESLERQVAESEYIAEEAVGGDELLVDKLALEDEVSESRALMEEQDLEEDADLSEEALDDDLSDIPQILEGNDNPGKSEADPNGEKNTSNNEDEDSENESDGEDSAEVSESSKDEGPVGQQVEEDFVPITETVRQVFERMLEQRSLLIVKNKARGLFESEETGSAPVVVSQSLPVNNTAPSVPDAVSLASLPLVPTA